MKPQSTYFLYGYYGAGNFGDDILLRAVIENILLQDSSAEFLIRNHGPVDYLSDFGDRITLTDIEKIHQHDGLAIIKFFHLLRAYWSWMGRASHLVVGGGTLIHDAPYLKSTFLLLCLAMIARLRNRKVFGVGLGTKKITTRAGRTIVRLLIRFFHRLCLRDIDSLEVCRALSPQAKNLILTSDLAFSLAWPKAECDTVIGVTLVDYVFENGRNTDLVLSLAQSLSNFISKGHDIRFMILQKRSYAGGGDESVLQQVLDKIPAAQRTRCRTIFLEPTQEAVQEAFNGLGLMLGMRFHALVFAALQGIPFAGLAHEPKIDAIAREFNMPFLSLARMDAVSLTGIMEEGLRSRIDESRIMQDQVMAKNNFIF